VVFKLTFNSFLRSEFFWIWSTVVIRLQKYTDHEGRISFKISIHTISFHHNFENCDTIQTSWCSDPIELLKYAYRQNSSHLTRGLSDEVLHNLIEMHHRANEASRFSFCNERSNDQLEAGCTSEQYLVRDGHYYFPQFLYIIFTQNVPHKRRNTSHVLNNFSLRD
jgi:hypothetical protein